MTPHWFENIRLRDSRVFTLSARLRQPRHRLRHNAFVHAPAGVVEGTVGAA
jgi:hypothetical protein